MTNNVKAAQAEKEAAKIAALQAAAAQEAADMQAHADGRKFLFDAAERYGSEAATGDMALTALCFLYNHATRQGHAGPDDANEIYGKFAGAYNTRNAAGHVMLGNVKVSTRSDSLTMQEANSDEAEENRRKVSASLVRTFAKAGCVAQGSGWFDRVRMLRDAIAVDDRAQSSMFNAWVAANRVANDAKSDATISDADIVAALTKAGKAAKKTALEKLTRLVADAAKLAKNNPDFVGLDKVAGVLAQIEAAAKLGIKMEHVTPSVKVVPASELLKSGTTH
jgi:hypothetical protein